MKETKEDKIRKEIQAKKLEVTKLEKKLLENFKSEFQDKVDSVLGKVIELRGSKPTERCLVHIKKFKEFSRWGTLHGGGRVVSKDYTQDIKAELVIDQVIMSFPNPKYSLKSTSFSTFTDANQKADFRHDYFLGPTYNKEMSLEEFQRIKSLVETRVGEMQKEFLG